MKRWIIPSIYIYKLSKKESKNTGYLYECIDGQHRLTTIKNYIEDTNKKLYYKDNDSNKYYYSNLSKEDLDIFNNFPLSIYIIQTDSREPLKLQTKCKIFNLLQNGEPVSL